MFIGQFTQKSHLFLHYSQIRLISHQNRQANLIFMQKFRYSFTRPAVFYSIMASESETSLNLRNEKKNIPCNPERLYEVVVAATRDMGIGKDGKLPWTLPSDLRFFKELTTTTTADGKRNAVIMGRRTWESIPQRYRPLPGRLNVVLTRAGEMEVANSFQELVICNNLSLALKLLAEPPHSESIEKVFVIGGGQILKETLNGPGCEAIHLTDIEANIECDTFIPRIDLSLFHLLFSSSHIVENNIRFSFKTYVRLSNCTEEIYTAGDDKINVDRETTEFKKSSFSERFAEFDYVKQIQENIAGGKCI